MRENKTEENQRLFSPASRENGFKHTIHVRRSVAQRLAIEQRDWMLATADRRHSMESV